VARQIVASRDTPGAVMTFDELPLGLTSFLERESWVRIAASAYRHNTSGDTEIAVAEMIDYLQQCISSLFSCGAAPDPSVFVWHPERALSYFSIDVTLGADTDK
jgi:hypothetical protein